MPMYLSIYIHCELVLICVRWTETGSKAKCLPLSSVLKWQAFPAGLTWSFFVSRIYLKPFFLTLLLLRDRLFAELVEQLLAKNKT